MVAAVHLEEVPSLPRADAPDERVATTSLQRLETMLAELGVLAVGVGVGGGADPGSDQVAAIDRISTLERLRGAVAAAQASECVRFARRRVQQSLADSRLTGEELDPGSVHRGIVDELALACGIAPQVAARRLGAARAWTADLLQTFAALADGRLSERVAESVVTETRHLAPEDRQRVDREVAERGIDRLGAVAAERLVRTRAYAVDPKGYLERGRTERRHRRVGLRAAPDTMAILTGYLPVEQGVACIAALRRHTDQTKKAGDDRTRDQIMADTLVERLTGQATATDIGVELQILVPVESLTDPTGAPEPTSAAPGSPRPAASGSAVLSGWGPLPLGIVREILRTTRAQVWWRRLFTRPAGRADGGTERMIAGGDRRRRFFDAYLRMLITARDQTCRIPYCDAPIREIDHVRPWAAGGETTLPNGQGLCRRHNQDKELPGWTAHRTRIDTTTVCTPTGHCYQSRDPDPP